MTPEFNVIAQYFMRPYKHTDLGVGDDAALLRVSTGHQLAVSSDMSVAGTHFFHDCVPADIGWKSMAVNISDMAAMGATPKWATLAIALPDISNQWLAEFSRGFFACADQFHVDLIGGDTTRGPLNISVTIMGEVAIGQALTRCGAQAGDDIWVSGTLGSAALGLAHLQHKTTLTDDALQPSIHALYRPMPRIDLGLALRGIATSCIDISDGLLADLGHILSASQLSAEVHLEKLPMSRYHRNHLHQAAIQSCVLAGGDDYELCFTAPASQRNTIELMSKQLSIALTRIASTHKASDDHTSRLMAMYQNTPLHLPSMGFDHFG